MIIISIKAALFPYYGAFNDFNDFLTYDYHLFSRYLQKKIDAIYRIISI